MQRKSSKRGPALNYPVREGHWGCPLPYCPNHFICPFNNKSTAKKHYFRHGNIPSSNVRLKCFVERFTIIYRWNSGASDFNSCFARLLAREFEDRGIIPWLDKDNLAPEGSDSLTHEVGKALEKANRIVICLSKGDLLRCSEFEDDFFAFELKTALDLADRGKPVVVLMHKVSPGSMLGKKVVEGMDYLHDGLGSRLKTRLINFRRYDINFGVPDDNFDSILDGICGKR